MRMNKLQLDTTPVNFTNTMLNKGSHNLNNTYCVVPFIQNLKIGKTWRKVIMKQGNSEDSWGACNDLFLCG